MEYTTVFEITQKPFQWWFCALGLFGIPIGIVLIFVAKKWRSQARAKFVGYIMLTFGSIWSAVVFVSTYSDYRQCLRAYLNRSYSVVEGSVQDFRPMPYEGHSDECFRVQTETFCYSDYTIQPGFNHSASHGGPIRQGLTVRISYYRGNILKLEVGSDR